MKLLIMQPKLESGISQLENELDSNPQVDAVVFPEGYLNENVSQACALAKQYSTILIGGYRRFNEKPKDRAILINRDGEILLDRAKYTSTASVRLEGLTIGHILCDELIVQGVESNQDVKFDLLIHPIGVGMFSQEQFDEWIATARNIAVAYNAMVVGASHADGSFRNSDVSISIAYCIGRDGIPIFVLKNDVRSVILDTATEIAVFAHGEESLTFGEGVR